MKGGKDHDTQILHKMRRRMSKKIRNFTFYFNYYSFNSSTLGGDYRHCRVLKVGTQRFEKADVR